MIDPLLAGGLVIACFVAYNVGGATSGPAFGPAVGAGVVSKMAAGALMSVCFFVGAWTLGRRVVDTLGEELVHDPAVFTMPASIVVLFFIGGALLIGNVSGAPASTSMTAVGSIAGLGLATGELNPAVVSEILAWWIVSPVIGFWLAVMIGRYFYADIDRVISIDRSDGPLVTLDTSGAVPRPAPGPNTTRQELVGSAVVVGIGCLMAVSSGASNIANAIAPLVGSDAVGMNFGILLGSAAVAAGALTIARRTMETLGNDITDLPLTAAIVVAVLSSSIVLVLSAIGVPASFVIIATVCIVGLGWGRSTSAVTVADAVHGDVSPRVSIAALTADDGAPTVGEPADGTASEGATTGPRHADGHGRAGDSRTGSGSPRSDLFDPGTTVRVVVMQNVVPVVATVGSYLTFTLLGPL